MSKTFLAGLTLSLAALQPLGAQAMGDESRLTVGIHGGFIGAADLWSVSSQPVYATADFIDQFRLDRSLRSNFGLNAQLHYFPTPSLGWTVELGYIGLGTQDRCTLLTGGVLNNRQACETIDMKTRPASAVAGMVGAIFRVNSRGDVQPYVRGAVGLALVPRSTTEMSAIFPVPGTLEDYGVFIYEGDDSRNTKPTVSAGFGLATSPRKGYQFRFEARLQGVQLSVVDGPTNGISHVPEVSSRWFFLPTLTLGIDVVLEKRRGRRY